MNTTQFKAFTQLMQDSARVQPCAEVANAIAQAPAVHEKVLLPKSGGAVPAAAAADAPQPKAPEKLAAVQKEAASPPEPAQQPEQTALQLQDAGAFHIVGEVLHTYIIVEQDDTVLFIDKHAAHERILFEQLKANPTQMMGQLLLEPVICNFDREEAAILQAHASLLQELGYDITDLADGTLLLRQIPSDLAVEDAQCCLNALANDLLHGKHTDPTALRDTLLHTIACKAAIKAGSRTEPAERARLVQQVMTNPALKHCPHGRPICTSLTKAQLERQFKRT